MHAVAMETMAPLIPFKDERVMTRETKIGLLIGTAIILLVGILVSHYLADAPQQQAPSFNRLAPDVQHAIGDGSPGSGPGGSGVIPPGPGQTGTRERQLANGGGNNNDLLINNGVAGEDPNHVAVPFGGNGSGRATAIYYFKAGDKLTDLAKTYYGDPKQWKLIAQANPGAIYDTNKVRPGVRLVIPLPERASVIGGGTAGGGTSGGGGAIVDSGKTIKAEAGDTLGKLAAKYLGSSKHWPELLKANADKLKRPEDLKPGMELRLPTLAAAPSPAPTTPAPGRAPGAPGVGPAGSPGTPGTGGRDVAPPIGNGHTYVVQSGDTLSTIARKTLGSVSRANEIFEANKTALKAGPNKLSIGQALIIPSATAAAPRPTLGTGSAAAPIPVPTIGMTGAGVTPGTTPGAPGATPAAGLGAAPGVGVPAAPPVPALATRTDRAGA
jgi:nucleoid-associated protein YgaU